ncbi:MAG: hypothetical protein AABX61_00690 [Nanoarchaeota archaeon]
MIEQVKQDILNVIKEALIAIKKNDAVKLRDLSNQTLHSSSIFQDENSISIAVVCYALSKIFERIQYKEYKDWNVFYETCLTNLKNSQEYLEKDNLEDYRNSIKNILNVIDKLNSNLKKYVKELINTAQIAKGSRLYEHGISIGRTAELLGISKWELMDYIGKTGIPDVEENLSFPIDKRIKFARSLFI